MYCEKCGAEIKPGAQFCGKCGEPVSIGSPTISKMSNKGKKNFLYDKSKIWIIVGGIVIALMVIIILINQLNRIDPFEGIELEYTGYETEGEINIISEPINKGFTYSIEGEDGTEIDYFALSNGDVFVIRAELDGMTEDEFFDQYGKRPGKMTKKYTVEGLAHYLNSFSEVSTKQYDMLKTKAHDRIEEILDDRFKKGKFPDNTTTGELNYFGYILIYLDDPQVHAQVRSILYVVYEAPLKNTAGLFEDVTVYYPIGFENIGVTPDGKILYDEDRMLLIDGVTQLPGCDYIIEGYTDPQKCFDNVWGMRQRDFEKEAGDGFKGFGTKTIAEEFDPFSLIRVKFSGENGSGTPEISFVKESDYIRDLKYHIEDLSQELSNGDKVTITVAYKTNEDDYVAKYNKKPSVFSKEYVVESLDEAKPINGEMDGLIEEFNKMLQGVWVAPTEYGPYYIYFDGNNNITKGWYSLNTSSVSHITNIEERENNEYFVEFECEDFKDPDGISHDGYPYTGFYSSSDGFVSNLIAEDSDSTYGYTLVKAGSNIEEAEKYIKKEFKVSNDTDSSDWIVGTWMNSVSDPVDAYSSQYQFDFHKDGTVDLTGYRNKDHGTYKDNGDGTATATFNECYFEGADSGSGKLEGLKYTVRISKGNNCIDVKFDDVFYKDGYSNASDGTYYKQ